MRTLTERQHAELDRIGNSPAGHEARVVGWLLGGPVIRLRGRLALLKPHGDFQAVAELEATEA